MARLKPSKTVYETRTEKIERHSREKTRQQLADERLADKKFKAIRKKKIKKHTFEVVYARGKKPVFK